MNTLSLHLKSQRFQPDPTGHAGWASSILEQQIPAEQTALVICDMWDQHWSRGAAERVDRMAPLMNHFVGAARRAGVHVIHAPSETLPFYQGSAARLRVQSLPVIQPPPDLDLPEPPLPIDDSDGGSDTGERPWFRAWTRQHPAIEIDEQQDGISDSGPEIYSYLRAHSIQRVLLAGVHTNMCILNRSFGIKQMARWKVPIALVRDLTDTMYNPASSPYVSHEEGTRLVVEYIEKFWCPTIVSSDILG
jgi:nicotinamidase-related amidase